MKRTIILLTYLLLCVSTLGYTQQTYYVSTSGSDSNDGLSAAKAWKTIAHAFQQVPEGDHTIQLSQGIFVIDKTVRLKSGWTLNGQGHSGSNTTTIINAASFGPTKDPCQLEANAHPENYLVDGSSREDITISNLIFTSREDTPLDGALLFKEGKRVELFNLLVDNFRWNGIYIYLSDEVNIHHSFFENASYKDLSCFWGGAIRTRYMEDFELHHCEFKTTKGGGYGYKGSGHKRAKIHDNIFHNNTSLGPNDGRPFDFESAHELEYSLEIYNNTFNAMVSVPKGYGQSLTHPDGSKHPYTVRIHDNIFYGSGGIEGPRAHLEIDHNYFANKWGNDGRVYEVHGGESPGPVKIHHNVAECSMGFVFKQNELNENVSILNNTIYLVNSTRHNFPTNFLEVGGGIANWQVKNNIIFTLDEPNNGTAFSRGSLPTSGLTMSHNLAWNIPGTPAGVEKTDPGLALTGEKPTAYYLAKDQSSAVVDAGTDVGFAFQGSAPDIGAYEWNNVTPSPAVEYTISASVTGGNGSISPSGNVSVEQDKNKTFTITANEGYQIKDVLVDGSSVGKLATYTFTSVTANHTISASFVATAPITQPVTAITISGPATIITDGGSAQLEATVDPGDATNKSVTWSIQGADLGASVSATGLLTASGQDGGNGTVTVRATAQDGSGKFDEQQVSISNQSTPPPSATEYTIEAIAGSNGTISPIGTVQVTEGGEQSFTITADEGYRIKDVLVDQASVGALSSYTFTKLNQNHSIEVSFEALPDTEAPTKPTLTAQSPTSFSVDLSWTPASDNVAVTGYEVYQDNTLIAALSGGETSYTATDLSASTTYTFTLKAKDAADNTSPDSNPVTITTQPPSTDTQAPSTPALSLDSQTTSSASLSWTASIDNEQLAFYYLYQDGVQVATLPSSSTSHTLIELTQGSYAFSVVAVDQAGNQSEESNAITVIIPSVAPDEPVTDTEAPGSFKIDTTVVTSQSATLNWTTPTDNTGIAYYLLYQDGEVIDTLESQVNTYTLESLEAGGTYLITLEAYDQASNSTAVSLTVEVPTAVSPTEQPLTIQPEKILSPNNDQQNDTWQIAVAQGYELFSVKIYNRSGQQVFVAGKNYQDQPWNGVWQGQPLATGAYYFVVAYRNTSTEQVSTATGSIALIR